MNRANAPHRAPAGFTLIELIVAMAMVTILATSLYASLRIAFKAQTSAEASVEPSRTAELAMEFLRADLENALPPNDVMVGSFIATDGTDDRGHPGDDVLFYTTAAAPDRPSANGDVKKVELTITVPDGQSDHMLVRRVTRNLLSQSTPDEQVICRGVSSFNLRYFDGTDWQDQWESSQQGNVLPAAVEVTLELERPGTSGAAPRTLRYVRVFKLSCAPAASEGVTF